MRFGTLIFGGNGPKEEGDLDENQEAVLLIARNRIQFINATLFDVIGQLRITAVKMMQRAITVSRENRNRRVLMPFAIFAAQIVLKSAVAGAQQT